MRGMSATTMAVVLAIAGCGRIGFDNTPCSTDLDCANQIFCDGDERCQPGPGADARGCVAATAPPCPVERVCDEAGRRCVTDCATSSDFDGDGSIAVECGGLDCDDGAAEVHPGATETCNRIDDNCNDQVDEPPAACAALALAVGTAHACAIVSDGSVLCWGHNENGQLGDGIDTHGPRCASPPQDCSPIPVRVLLPGAATGISLGFGHSCAILVSGDVWCWGTNSNGQLGDGTFTDHHVPAPVGGLTNVTRIAAGEQFTCASSASGVSCWGAGAVGQVGNGITSSQTTPQATSLPAADLLACGRRHACATTTGGLFCWGDNTNGQFGNGTTASSNTPTMIPAISDAVALAPGYAHTCILRTGGQVWCTGANTVGQLGDGTTAARTTYVRAGSLDARTAIGVGEVSSCAFGTDSGSCWGKNDFGQLGDATGINQSSPSPIVGLPGGTAIGGGSRATCAISGNHVSCWGDNSRGQLGDGTLVSRAVPGVVSGL